MRKRRTAVAATVAALVLATVLAAAPAGGVPVNATREFSVRQAGQCYTVTPLGNGTRTVAEHYDYRSPYTTPSSFAYASFGTTEIQRDQASQLYVYDGARGYSLVFLHDALNGSHGSTATLTVSGLPPDGEWVVQDDMYPGHDDVYRTDERSYRVHHMWGPNRTDGDAFRGLWSANYSGITVDPGFNGAAKYWGEWEYSGNESTRVTDWLLRSGDGQVHHLDLDEPVTVSKGTCGSSAWPNDRPSASLRANVTSAMIGEPVRLDAGGSTDDGNATAYRWDYDGDGRVDATTTSATTTHAYVSPGTYTARVTVVDGGELTDAANATVTVEAAPPARVLSMSVARGSVPAGVPVNVTATVTNGGPSAGPVSVNLTADGSVVASRTVTLRPGEEATVTFTPTFASAGDRALSAGRQRARLAVTPPAPVVEAVEVSVSPREVHPGQAVEIAATVRNVGSANGTVPVRLHMFGKTAAVENVTLAEGETTTVTFTRRIEATGTYTARVGDASATVRVVGDEGPAAEAGGVDGQSSGFVPLGLPLAVLAVALAAVLAARRRTGDR